MLAFTSSNRNFIGQGGTFEGESERGARSKIRNVGSVMNNPEVEISPMPTPLHMYPSKSFYEPDRPMTPGSSSVTRFAQTPI